MNNLFYRIVAAGVGFGAAKLAAKGISLSAEAQAAVTVGVYGATHTAFDWIAKRFGK